MRKLDGQSFHRWPKKAPEGLGIEQAPKKGRSLIIVEGAILFRADQRLLFLQKKMSSSNEIVGFELNCK